MTRRPVARVEELTKLLFYPLISQVAVLLQKSRDFCEAGLGGRGCGWAEGACGLCTVGRVLPGALHLLLTDVRGGPTGARLNGDFLNGDFSFFL